MYDPLKDIVNLPKLTQSLESQQCTGEINVPFGLEKGTLPQRTIPSLRTQRITGVIEARQGPNAVSGMVVAIVRSCGGSISKFTPVLERSQQVEQRSPMRAGSTERYKRASTLSLFLRQASFLDFEYKLFQLIHCIYNEGLDEVFDDHGRLTRLCSSRRSVASLLLPLLVLPLLLAPACQTHLLPRTTYLNA
jgi:hypothetical protein